MRAQLPSRVFYGLDLAAGWLTGCRCPSCDRAANPVRSTKHRVDGIRECQNCHLLYRPTAITKGRLARLYYSRFYVDAGIATDTAAAANLATLQSAVQAEGKDRAGLVSSVLSDRAITPQSICVFGCSWGYEIVALKALGLPVYGIELSDTRRRLATEQLGLRVFDSIESAAGEFADSLVVSSHVLEHIPDVARTLDEIQDRLCPVAQLHVTPSALVGDQVMTNAIGREHILGITGRFWSGYATQRGLQVSFGNAQARQHLLEYETLAVLEQ